DPETDGHARKPEVLLEPSSPASGPGIPKCKFPELVIKMRFLDESVNLSSGLARTEAINAVRNREAQIGGNGNVLPKLRQVNLVIGVGYSVIVDQIICFLLIGDEVRDTFQQKIHVISTHKRIGGKGVGAELPDRLEQSGNGINQIFAPAQRKPCCFTGAFVEGHHSDCIVEFVAMSVNIGQGAYVELLLARKEHEADGATGMKSGSFDGAKSLDDECGVAAIVQRSSAKFPGIQMRAKNEELIRLFPTLNLGNHILRGDQAAYFVRDRVPYAHRLTLREQTSDALTIFTSQHELREIVDVIIEAADVAVKQVLVASRDEGDSGRAGLYCGADQIFLFEIFVKQVIPGLHGFGMNQRNGAFEVCGFVKVLIAAERHVNYGKPLGRRGGRSSPCEGYGTKMEQHRTDHVNLSVPFGP